MMRSSFESTENHSKVRHSNGAALGKLGELNAVIPMMARWTEQIAEENHQVDDQHDLEKRRRAALGAAHLPISPILTLKTRIISSTKTMQVTSSTTA